MTVAKALAAFDIPSMPGLHSQLSTSSIIRWGGSVLRRTTRETTRRKESGHGLFETISALGVRNSWIYNFGSEM